MTAPNHALTGALLGLNISNPVLAVVLAFFSHFVLDILPHYDPPGKSKREILLSRGFFWQQIVLGAGLCGLLVLFLAATRPSHWLLAAVCAFVATIPDLLFFQRYRIARRTGRDPVEQNWFWHFHHRIQWFQRPIGIVVELAWFLGWGFVLLLER